MNLHPLDMKWWLREKIATATGYGLGLITGPVSFLRQGRMFHPKGSLYEGEFHAEVGGQILPPHALVRISAALFRSETWFDALGVAIRFSSHPIDTPRPEAGNQDLLFASFSSPWLTPLAPFISRASSYFANSYYTISPMEMEKEMYELKLVLNKSEAKNISSREIELKDAVLEGQVLLQLLRRKWHRRTEEWELMGELSLKRFSGIDQESLRFNPFLNGAGIFPRGFVHHLRIGAYKFSQLARPLHSQRSLAAQGNALPSSPRYHSP